MKKGDKTRKLFVITAGSVDVCHEDKVLHTKERGDVLDVYSLIQDNQHQFDFKVSSKDTMGYWLDLGLLKLLKDENVNFWDTLWKAAAADVIRYYFADSEALRGVDTADMDNMVHASPLNFFDAGDQERSQIRITRGLGILLNGQVVHITDMNEKAAAPAILPLSDEPYLAIEDSVVLNLDLLRRDYHAEKTNHLNPKLAAMMGVAAASAMPMASEESYASEYDDDYISGDEEEPVNGAAVAGGAAKVTDDEYDAEMALLDGKDSSPKPDLKISAMDSSNGPPPGKGSSASPEPKNRRGSKRASKAQMMARHKSSGLLGKDKLSYKLQPSLIDDELKKQVDGLSLQEGFEVMNTVLAKNDKLFDHLRKFHIMNVQKEAKMKIRVSSASKKADGKNSIFARPTSVMGGGDSLVPRGRRGSRSQSRSRSAQRGLDPFSLQPRHQAKHSHTPVIIKPKEFNETLQEEDDDGMEDLNKNAAD